MVDPGEVIRRDGGVVSVLSGVVTAVGWTGVTVTVTGGVTGGVGVTVVVTGGTVDVPVGVVVVVRGGVNGGVMVGVDGVVPVDVVGVVTGVPGVVAVGVVVVVTDPDGSTDCCDGVVETLVP